MDKSTEKESRSLLVLSYVNVFIWAVAMIAMVFLMKDYPGVKKMYPIMGGGTAVGISVLALAGKIRKKFHGMK